MNKLSSLPVWCELQKFPYAAAPRRVKMLCSGKAIKYFARRGTGTSREFVVWNSKGAWTIKANELD